MIGRAIHVFTGSDKDFEGFVGERIGEDEVRLPILSLSAITTRRFVLRRNMRRATFRIFTIKSTTWWLDLPISGRW